MPKIKFITNTELTFYCLACKEYHNLNTTWNFNGNFDKPTIRPSLLITLKWWNEITNKYDKEVQRCHSYITDGKIEYLSDCKHDMKGMTVELPNVDWLLPSKIYL